MGDPLPAKGATSCSHRILRFDLHRFRFQSAQIDGIEQHRFVGEIHEHLILIIHMFAHLSGSIDKTAGSRSRDILPADGARQQNPPYGFPFPGPPSETAAVVLLNW